MKIEIEIKGGGKEKNGKTKDGYDDMHDLEDKNKMAIGEKLKKNIALTRLERKLLSGYLLKEED